MELLVESTRAVALGYCILMVWINVFSSLRGLIHDRSVDYITTENGLFVLWLAVLWVIGLPDIPFIDMTCTQ